MPSRALTAAAVERIKPPTSGQVDYFDKGFPGLVLRCSYGGSKSWAYVYRLHGRKLRRLTLGHIPAMSLAEARSAWQDARKTVGKGESPKHRRPAEADSFAAVADDWLKRDQAKNRSAQEVKRVIERDVKPRWDGRMIADITRRDVIELIDRIADRGAVTMARNTHAHLHRLFRWSVGRGIIESNPLADLPKPGAAVKRDRVLSDAELAAVWTAASQTEWPFGPMVQLLILTAARRDEIGALCWPEIHGDQIELRGARTKNGAAHIIPLSATAVAIVKSLPRMHKAEHVFTTTGTSPVSGWSKWKLHLDEQAAKINGRPLPEWRFHDLRRTAATGLQRLGVSLQVVEAVLGHISGSRAGIVGVYQTYNYDAEKKAALEAWARHVVGLAGSTPANVIPIRRKVP